MMRHLKHTLCLLLFLPLTLRAADEPYHATEQRHAEPFRPYGELVLYPKLSLDNHTLDVIYHVSLSLAPALELHPWPGGKLTGQIILPLWTNDHGSEQRRVRAGVNTLQQELRLGRRLLTRATVGLFTNHRAGVDLRAAYLWLTPETPLAFRGTCLLTAEAGCTGLYICDSRTRYFERWRQWSGAVGLDYFHHPTATRLELRHLYTVRGEPGWRADLTRHFRTVALGFYGLTIRRDYNLGFHFAIRFRSARPRPEARLRVRGPYYWDWQYTMKSKSYHPGYASTYETTPDWNHADPFGRQLLGRPQ
jgi:hypothetical protein